MYWLLVGLVRSLKSSHKEALRKSLLCEDIDITVSVVYDTLKNFFFTHACSYCLILHFNCEMKLSVILL